MPRYCWTLIIKKIEIIRFQTTFLMAFFLSISNSLLQNICYSEMWKSNNELNQKVNDMSLSRSNTWLSRALDKFHPDKQDALQPAHSKFISSSALALWKKKHPSHFVSLFLAGKCIFHYSCVTLKYLIRPRLQEIRIIPMWHVLVNPCFLRKVQLK